MDSKQAGADRILRIVEDLLDMQLGISLSLADRTELELGVQGVLDRYFWSDDEAMAELRERVSNARLGGEVDDG